jgi:hypothetical protein
MESYLVELAAAVFGSAVFGLFGFVWKTSHRVSSLESKLQNMERSHAQQMDHLQQKLDTVTQGLDKNREWTTNRMLSIAKELKD